ncbi:MAG TPA: WbqC family protein [Pyrinomonadaceae bacterium]|nr:WbqC family protein [Pyrinomonadaceae bacterium]
MKVAIHQPQYFPWPPYVHKVMSADIFVYLDTVQFSKNGLQNRNQIRAINGPAWLTVPVTHKFGSSIRETAIANGRTLLKHWKTLQANYSRSEGFQRWRDELAALFQEESASLADLAINSTEWMLKKLDVQNKRILASELPGIEGQASELVASICKHLGATRYLTGTGALAYLNPADFSHIGCELWVQQWRPITYHQAPRQTAFVPDLSTLDLLLNCPDQAGEIIKAAGSWRRLEQ